MKQQPTGDRRTKTSKKRGQMDMDFGQASKPSSIQSPWFRYIRDSGGLKPLTIINSPRNKIGTIKRKNQIDKQAQVTETSYHEATTKQETGDSDFKGRRANGLELRRCIQTGLHQKNSTHDSSGTWEDSNPRHQKLLPGVKTRDSDKSGIREELELARSHFSSRR